MSEATKTDLSQSAVSVARLVVKLGVALALAYIILRRVDLERVLDTIGRTSPLQFSLALLLQCLTLAVSALRWQVCLNICKVPSRVWDTLRIYFATTFVGTALPTGIGQDVLRVYAVGRSYGHEAHVLSRVTASVIVDRAFGLTAFAIFAAPALLAYSRLIGISTECAMTLDWSAPHEVLLIGGAASIIVFALILVLGSRHRNLTRDFKRILVAIALEAANLFLVFALSMLIVIMVVGVVFILGTDLTSATPFTEYLVTIPVIAFLAQLPLSVLGLGVREMSFVLLFACASASREDALALSIVYFAIGLLANLLCGYFYFGPFSKVSRGTRSSK